MVHLEHYPIGTLERHFSVSLPNEAKPLYVEKDRLICALHSDPGPKHERFFERRFTGEVIEITKKGAHK
jgi:hypothetical protein